MPQGAFAKSGLLRLLFVSVCVVCAPPGAARAQLIPVKTARVAEADLSSYFPAANAGMGTLLLIRDTLLEPFNNPATGRLVHRTHVIGSVGAYSISHDLGTGSTTPIGVFRPFGAWFGGFSVARQAVSPPEAFGFQQLDQADKNTYGFVLLGRGIGSVSLGVSAAWSALTALDGATLLYPGMSSVDRSTHALDVRLGATKAFRGGTSIEAVLLKARASSSHVVTFMDQVWNPNLPGLSQTPRVVDDHDRVETMGAHVVLSRPLPDSTWRVGAGLTANRIEHTLMPVLGATSLRRDPGRSTALNAILGVSRSGSTLRYGLDAIYEPIWSRASLNGAANDDRYRFNNAVVRGGISADYRPMGLQTAVRVLFGAQVRAYNYELKRRDTAQVVTATHNNWQEWTHNWGLSFLDKALSLHLQWRVQSGARRPGFEDTQPVIAFDSPGSFAGPTFGLLATRVSTFQIAVEVPIP